MSSLYAEEIKRVKDLLVLMGRGAKKSLGQNFLVNSQKIELIVQQLRLNGFTSVVEVGPGLGALTLRLRDLDPQLLLIEMDTQFAEYWKSQGCQVVVADALNMDWKKLHLKNATLISNLPYQIAARLVIERSVHPDGITSMVLMFQKEVAQRLTARFRTEHYSLLSVIAQTFWRLENLTELGPNDYFPPPKVASRVVIFRAIQEGLPPDPEQYLEFVKLSFSQKRKFLKKALGRKYGDEAVLNAFEKLGISPKARPEELEVLTFQRLYQILGADKDSVK
jgi:16S rRNA (adenine1518-N6/adenine1519-N6)-dimethyltransferase